MGNVLEEAHLHYLWARMLLEEGIDNEREARSLADRAAGLFRGMDMPGFESAAARLLA